MQLTVVVSWIAVLHATLWRAALIPRGLALTGLMTAALQLTGVPLRALLGYPSITGMAPLVPADAGLALSLLLKGFDERGAVTGQPSAPFP